MTTGILKAVSKSTQEQATSHHLVTGNEPGRDAETSSTSSTLSDGASDLDMGIRTRSSSGISKKRVLADAASDTEIAVPVTPPKKSRTAASRVVLGIQGAEYGIASDSDALASHSDSSAIADSLSMSPLKLIGALDGRESPSPLSKVISALDGCDTSLSSAITELSKSDGKKRAGTPFTPLEDTVNTPLSSVEKLHPDEAANLARAISESKRESMSVARHDVGSSTSVHSMASTDTNCNLPSTLSHPRKSFKDVVPPSLVGSQPVPMMSSGIVLLDDLMRYQVRVLPKQCQVNDPDLHDTLLADDYATLPPLKKGILKSWSTNVNGSSDMERLISFSQWSNQCPNLDFYTACDTVRFTRYGHFINPSRISPLDVNILFTSFDRKRSVLQCNYKTAICVSPILSVESHLVEPARTGLKNKFLSGHFHLQEWQRLAGFACMVFDRSSLVAQIFNDTISFVTSGPLKSEREAYYSQSKALKNPGILISKPGTAMSKAARSKPTFKSTLTYTDEVPVYDAREMPFNFASDFDNIDTVLPRFEGEIPLHSFVVVGYTMTHYDKDGHANLSTNILFAILFATD